MQGRPDSPWSQLGPTHTQLTMCCQTSIHTFIYIILVYQSMLSQTLMNSRVWFHLGPLYTIIFFYKIGIKSCWRMLLENTWIVWTDQMTCEPLPLKTVLLWNEGQQFFFSGFLFFPTFVVEVKWLCYGVRTMHSKLRGKRLYCKFYKQY